MKEPCLWLEIFSPQFVLDPEQLDQKASTNLLSSDHALNKNEILSSENVNQTSVPLSE